MRRGCQWLLVLVLLAAAAPAAAGPAEAADGEEDWMSRQAIQNRKHGLRHELGIALGTIPIDPFYKGLCGTAQYTFHFGNSWAWELFNVGYSKNFWTSLRKDLEQNWRNPASPQVIPEVEIFGDSNLVFKPLYGKLAYLNRSLVYGEFYLAAGPAVAWYNTRYDRLSVGADVGFGFRVHLSPYWSVRFDVRYYRFQKLAKKDSTGDDVLFLQLGMALNLGGKQ
ncbi:MAG: outer membrane beta-barrel domain-containing protein [Deltaproteobacteria bacterium]|nr:outer membrane beta-barrel domain-containing protein [Deltaproteobacteria bacterium]